MHTNFCKATGIVILDYSIAKCESYQGIQSNGIRKDMLVDNWHNEQEQLQSLEENNNINTDIAEFQSK